MNQGLHAGDPTGAMPSSVHPTEEESAPFQRLFFGADIQLGPCTSKLVLTPCGTALILRPGCVGSFAMRLNRQDVTDLLIGLEDDEFQHWDQPHETGPTPVRLAIGRIWGRMAVSTTLGTGEMTIRFSETQLARLLDYLTEAESLLPDIEDSAALSPPSG
ncbi:hypothetical protein UA75_25545 [Actinoalloteichus sp. GBA129-24]|uniref:Uncharacterized protein n=2 Tax=Pseudonocardiaceae TaxID=2070 RepID=A0AAC9LG71_9PSEU|nr:hypothetical protein UA74_24965 [Actinoalloteichus fjordicus]APU23087.1 hypothetical protein UA75_25545 [Actinoalloteichus sp. GBA129-24]